MNRYFQAALLQTKNLKDDPTPIQPQHTTEEEAWITKVVEDEHVKPLQVH
jgi:hypothetical protein